jgi:hypothetical protein
VKRSWAATLVVIGAISISTVLSKMLTQTQLNSTAHKTIFNLQYVGYALALNFYGMHAGAQLDALAIFVNALVYLALAMLLVLALKLKVKSKATAKAVD